MAVRDSGLLDDLRPAAVYQIWEFNPQNLAKTVWAWASLAVSDSGLLDGLGSALVYKIWGFNSQGLANTCWTLATLTVRVNDS